MAVRQLPGDWEQRHGERPVLLETFVDETRFNATTVRAANWQKVGLTKGVKATPKNPGKSPKAVYLYPLTTNCQSLLKDGPPRVKRLTVRHRRTVIPQVA